MSDIQVSILTMVYNQAQYIRQALDSFLSQKTDFEYEILIHDDHSTDGTVDIIREYESRYPGKIRSVLQEENKYTKGEHLITKYLVPLARGKYYAICECDDYWCDDTKLQKQYDALEAHPECSMAAHKKQDCTDDGELIDNYTPEDYLNISGTQIFTGRDLVRVMMIESVNPFHTSCFFVRREVFEVPLSYPRDTGVLRRAMMLGGVYYIDEIMSIYRKFSANSYTTKIRDAGGLTLDFYLHELEYEMTFDEESGHKFHDGVMCRNLSLVHNLIPFDLKLARDYVRRDYKDYKRAYEIWKDEVPPNIWRNLAALNIGIPAYKVLETAKNIKVAIMKITGIKKEHRVYGLYT